MSQCGKRQPPSLCLWDATGASPAVLDGYVKGPQVTFPGNWAGWRKHRDKEIKILGTYAHGGHWNGLGLPGR